MRAPAGSKSGSARTSASTVTPKTSTVNRVPGSASSDGTHAYAIESPSE